jgi:hypothetical protein
MSMRLTTKRPKCPKGTRRNKKTNLCESPKKSLLVFKDIELNDRNIEKFNEYRQRYMEHVSENKMSYLPGEILKQDEDTQIDWIIKHGENTTLKLLQNAFDQFYKTNEVNFRKLNIDEINKKWNEYFDKYDEDDILNVTSIQSDTIKRDNVLEKQKDTSVSTKTKVKICPPGKEINPKTGRCINIKKPKTTQKKKIVLVNSPKQASINANIKVCPPGKEINPKTGRCINIKKPKTTRKIKIKDVALEPIQHVKQFEDMIIHTDELPPYQGQISNVNDFKKLLYYTLNNGKVFNLYKLNELMEKRGESFINVNNSIKIIPLDNFKKIARELNVDNSLSKDWSQQKLDDVEYRDFSEKMYYFNYLMRIISLNDFVKQFGEKRINSKDLSDMKLKIESIKDKYKYNENYTTQSIYMLVQYKYILDKTKLNDNEKETILFDLITLSRNAALENGYKNDIDEIHILHVIFGSPEIYDLTLFM